MRESWTWFVIAAVLVIIGQAGLAFALGSSLHWLLSAVGWLKG